MVAMVVLLLTVAAASAAEDAGDQAEQPPEHKPHICHFLHNGNFTLKKVRKHATKLCVKFYTVCTAVFFAFLLEYFTLG